MDCRIRPSRCGSLSSTSHSRRCRRSRAMFSQARKASSLTLCKFQPLPPSLKHIPMLACNEGRPSGMHALQTAARHAAVGRGPT